jgi:uncharacterized spore protein YtfJ
MEKTKRIDIGTPVKVAGVTIIPVSQISYKSWHGKRGIAFYGSKKPVNIIVITPTSKKAFRINGEETDLERLAGEIPGVAEVLANI